MGKVITETVRGATHNLKTEWLTARVVNFMFCETHGANWWITTLTSDGRYLHGQSVVTYAPNKEHQEYAHRVCHELNKHAHYGGAWLVGWIDDAKAFICIWKDNDGDIQTLIDCIKPWEVIRTWPYESWLGKAHRAYTVWFDTQEAIDAKKNQQVKLAQGQTVPT